MYRCKIKFKLYLTTSRRSLEQKTKEGTCTQTGTVFGSENKNPTVADSTGTLDCDCDLDENVNYSRLEVNDFVMTSVNGKEDLSDDVDANGLSSQNLKEQQGSSYEDRLKEIAESYFYEFEPSTKSCKCKNGVASLNLKGSVANYDDTIDTINGEYTFDTTENQKANCTLLKLAGSTYATIKCKANTLSKTFNFKENEAKNNENDKINSFLSLETNSKTPLCEAEDDNSNVSSSSGISGGAIAGIVICCIVVMLIVGVIIAYYAMHVKGAAVAAASSSQVIAGTDSHSGFVVPTSVSQAKIGP